MKKGFSIDEITNQRIRLIVGATRLTNSAVIDNAVELYIRQNFPHLEQPIQPRKRNSKPVPQKTQERVTA